MHPVQPVYLSEDLIAPILSHLPNGFQREAKASLLSCSLVSWKFRKYALPRVFENIRIRYFPGIRPRYRYSGPPLPYPAYTIETFHGFLFQNMHIASFIRHLHLEGGDVFRLEVLDGAVRRR